MKVLNTFVLTFVLLYTVGNVVLVAAQAPVHAPTTTKTLTETETKPQKYTSDWAVHIPNGDVKSIQSLEELGFEIVGQIGALDDYYLLRHHETNARHNTNPVHKQQPSMDVTAALLKHPGVKWAQQQHILDIVVDAVPTFTDPKYASQWHLSNTAQIPDVSMVARIDLNVTGAWDLGYSGAGVQIAVVDDGLEAAHPDISPNFVLASSKNFATGPANDPTPPLKTLTHGTQCGSIAFAAANSVCGVGVAYKAKGAGLRLLETDQATDANFAIAMNFDNQKNHIYSNSYGKVDLLGYSGPLTRAAWAKGVAEGRGGKGSIFVCSAGNNGFVGESSNEREQSNNRYFINVGAIGGNGKKSIFSENGANVMVVAPSNSGSFTSDGIRTATVTTTGDDGADCSKSFSGTSASTPMVAGVAALVLEANPALTWRDVPYILATTARKIDDTDSDWVNNKAGLPVNHKYGFGLVDAGAAVVAAKKHTLLNAEQKTSASSNNSTVIPSPLNGPEPKTFKLSIESDLSIERVVVTVDSSDTTQGSDWAITVKSPGGTTSVLAESRMTSGRVTLYIGETEHYPKSAPYTTVKVRKLGTGHKLVVPQPANTCVTPTNCAALSGNIAYIDSTDTTCSQKAKVILAQGCGAIGVVFWGSNLNPLANEGSETTPLNIFVLFYFYGDSHPIDDGTAVDGVSFDGAVFPAFKDWPFSSVRYLNEKSKGEWTVTITNMIVGSTGSESTLNSIKLDVFGNIPSTPTTAPNSVTNNVIAVVPQLYVVFCVIMGLVLLL